jgi:hypothetical protein
VIELTSSYAIGTSPHGPAARTTYAPPMRADELPASKAEWRRRAGLTDPAVLAANVRLRTSGNGTEPSYADFFRLT